VLTPFLLAGRQRKNDDFLSTNLIGACPALTLVS
jgi:hypothetical protein